MVFFFRSYIPRRARHSNIIPPSTSTAVGASNYNRFYQLFLNESPLTERFAREFSGDTIPSRSSGAIWRSYVYQRALYAMPLVDVTGRGRDISARFYRENPAQVHRLMPWLNREMMWILSSFMPVSYMMGMLAEFLVTYDITSRQFRNHVSTYFHRFTSHFIHELTNFARSQYDMIGYDIHVQYRPYFEEETENVEVFSDESNFGSSVIVSLDRYFDRSGASGSNSAVTSVISIPSTSSTTTAAMTGPLDPLIFRPTTIQATPVNLTSVTIDSESSGDEVVFVREQKPPHLRTPVMVELNSDSDSDVQFITEHVPVKIEASASCNHPSNSQEVRDGGNSSADELSGLLIKPDVSITSRIKRVGFPRATATSTHSYAPPPPTCIYSSEDEYTGSVLATCQMPSSPLVARSSPLVDVEGTPSNNDVASSSFHVAERPLSTSSTSTSDVSRPSYRTANRKQGSKRLRQRETCVSSSSSSSSSSATSSSSTSPSSISPEKDDNGLDASVHSVHPNDAVPSVSHHVQSAPALSSSSSSASSPDDSSCSSADDDNLKSVLSMNFTSQSFASAAKTTSPRVSSSDQSSSESSHEEYVVNRQRKRILTKQKGGKSHTTAPKRRTLDVLGKSSRKQAKRTKRSSVINKPHLAPFHGRADTTSDSSDASANLNI